MIFNFWKKIFQYVDVEIFKFSNDWLTDFKNRHFIKVYFRHDEIRNVDETQIKIELIKLCQKLNFYASENVYNMNESVFYWKVIFEKILIIEQMFEKKHENFYQFNCQRGW